MKRRLFTASIGAALCFTSISRAEEPLELLKERFRTHWEPWKGFAPGTWIQVRTVSKSGASEKVSEKRQTLLKRDEKELTFESREVKRSTADDGTEVVELGEPREMKTPTWADMTYVEFKELRPEDLDVGGTKLACRVFQATTAHKIPKAEDGATERKSEWTLWYCAEVKEGDGIVKISSKPDEEGPKEFVTFDMVMVERDKAVKIGANSVTCSVWRYKSCSLDESITSSGESTSSAEIPGGHARNSYRWAYGKGTSKSESDLTTDVVEMNVVFEKTE